MTTTLAARPGRLLVRVAVISGPAAEMSTTVSTSDQGALLTNETPDSMWARNAATAAVAILERLTQAGQRPALRRRGRNEDAVGHLRRVERSGHRKVVGVVGQRRRCIRDRTDSGFHRRTGTTPVERVAFDRQSQRLTDAADRRDAPEIRGTILAERSQTVRTVLDRLERTASGRNTWPDEFSTRSARSSSKLSGSCPARTTVRLP